MNMCRFRSVDDPGYETFRAILLRYLKTIVDEAAQARKKAEEQHQKASDASREKQAGA